MTLYNYHSKKFKFTIVEDNDEILEDNDFAIEIMIKKDFLKNLLLKICGMRNILPALEVPLTRREIQVLEYISFGKNNAEIAETMNVSVHTAKVHIHNIFNKLSVQDRTEAVVKAIKYKLIDV